MKTFLLSAKKENKVFFLVLVVFTFLIPETLYAQNPSPVFATVTMLKAERGKELEFEKFVKETMKPIHQLRQKKGKIIGWYFFKVHFTGANDEYNYVGISYTDSWAKADPTEDWPALTKEAHPKADPVQVAAKMRELRTIVRQGVYFREENIDAPNTPPKFLVIDYMKVKPGMWNEYVRLEKEEWKKFHQYLADNKKSAGWGLWSRLVPGGSSSNHDFVTANRYSTFAQAGEVNYVETLKAVYPEVDPQVVFDKADKARDLVKSEVWELLYDNSSN